MSDPPSLLCADALLTPSHPLVEQLTLDFGDVALAADAHEASTQAASVAPALLLLGDLAARGDAPTLLDGIRRGASVFAPSIPVLVLSRFGSDSDVLRAFEAGADDFVTLPCPYLQVRARITALLRRAGVDQADGLMKVGPLQLDTAAHTVSLDGQPVTLCRREYELLVHLAREPARVFTKEELLRQVWGFRALGATRTLDSHASRLRRKLGRAGGPWIVNVWGVGYRLGP